MRLSPPASWLAIHRGRAGALGNPAAGLYTDRKRPSPKASGHPVQIATLLGHTAAVPAASFSPDGSRVVTASKDNTARIWNAATGPTDRHPEGAHGCGQAASFSPDGTRVVTASWTTRRGSGMPEQANPSPPDGAHGCGRGGLLQPGRQPGGDRVQDNTARIWNAATGEPIATLTGHTDKVMPLPSARTERVVTASDDNTARIWKPQQANDRHPDRSTRRWSMPRPSARTAAGW